MFVNVVCAELRRMSLTPPTYGASMAVVPRFLKKSSHAKVENNCSTFHNDHLECPL